MKYYFFINPVAGQGDRYKNLISEIEKAMERRDSEYEIIVSETKGHLKAKSREVAESLGGSEARFFAAGGDGTVNEVVNGAYGFDNIAVGVFPIGTGNDTVRNFPDAGDFMDVEAQLDGDVRKIDLIRYKGVVDGEPITEHCVNMINIGFDSNVVELALRLKEKPLIAGSMAYLLAVFGMFVKKKGISLVITERGKNVFSDYVVRDGYMLLCAVCNGSYCGGGIKSAPMAKLDDGVFELNIINDVTRLKFVRLFPSFRKGEHMSIPNIDDTIEVRECKDVSLESVDKFEFVICVDGEIKYTTGIRTTIEEKALNFIVPAR